MQTELDEAVPSAASSEARFGFGENWSRFLSILDEDRIGSAERSFTEFLGVEDLHGKRFLDIGCGSGLSSLVARRLGAEVTSFDYDTDSVACTKELKRRYCPDDPSWRIEHGSVLDRAYMDELGTFDIVYSWGVLHHTGAMWVAIENAISCVADPGGKLFIAIYNDQGWKSHVWWLLKFTYNRIPRFLRSPYVILLSAVTRLLLILKYTFKLKPMVAIAPLFNDNRARGMSVKYDRIDWIGGFPYEFASLQTLIDYFEVRGFQLINTRQNTSLGCHEISMQRGSSAE